MVDSRQKGARGETIIRDKLRSLTRLNWERIPGSGALDEKHGLKGDLYVPNEKNLFCIEVKSYKDDPINSKTVFNKSEIKKWWEQAVRQGKQVDREPMLIYKFNRSKPYVCVRFEDFFDLPDQIPCMVLTDGPDFNIVITELANIINYVEFIE